MKKWIEDFQDVVIGVFFPIGILMLGVLASILLVVNLVTQYNIISH